ncbi:hypothetical protein [Psychroserpens sp.]|uniref:hypothetical protein n=1 Tax=Psychroserpens sp. TaxID=2020870 RepID=UPI003C76E410
MKTNSSRVPDNFKTQFQTFKMLLKGSAMAKASSYILIGTSVGFMIAYRDNALQIAFLLIGVISIVFYIINYLSLKDIKQKSYTQTSLVSSISKFKTYMAQRKKYEIYFMGIWVLSLIPVANTYFKSGFKAMFCAIVYIAIVYLMGNLAYKKVDRTILILEKDMQKQL